MPEVVECPGVVGLRDLVRGLSGPEEAERFALHLETCHGCATAMDRELVGDPLLLTMRAQSVRVERPADDATVDLIQRVLQKHPTVTWQAGDTPSNLAAGGATETDFDFDEPFESTERPGELGRLGPYRLLEVIGSGGMGIVYRAEDDDLGRQVALKTMRPELARRPLARQRFLREARSAASVDHENVVGIYNVGEANSGGRLVPFLAMPWLKGETLEDRLLRGPLGVDETIALGRQMALGLAAAHARGLVHRDIKPANIWLEDGPAGRLKILDFGLARGMVEEARLTDSGTLLGTPAYMPPEQGRGDPVDQRADLFSLGAVLYRCVTGVPPFRGETVMAVLSSLALDAPVPPHVRVPAVPKGLSDFVMWTLEKDPARRPASADSVADELRALAEGAAKSGRPTAPRFWKRVRAAAAVSLAGSLVALAVLLLETPKGTIRIEIDDDKVEAVLTKTGVVIKGADGDHDIGVEAGEHGLTIRRDGFEFETPAFIVRRGDKVTLKVESLPGKIQVVRDNRVVGGERLPTPPEDLAAVRWALGLGAEVTIDDGAEYSLDSLQQLPTKPWVLVKIHLRMTQDVDDDSLRAVAGLANLRAFYVHSRKVTDAGMKHFAGLKRLEYLNLTNVAIKGHGLKELAGLKWLRELNLNGTTLTDAGMAALAEFPDLERLSFEGTQVGDAGVRHLAGLTKLQSLYMGGTRVGDEGIKAISGLRRLILMRVAGTRITDASLPILATFDRLERLHVENTKATTGAIEVLRRKLPKCYITPAADPSRPMSRARAAAEWVISLGGGVTIDAEPRRWIRSPADLPAGSWSLVEVDLENKVKVDDAGLKILAGLNGINGINLSNTAISDRGVNELAASTGFKAIILLGTNVTDEGLCVLADRVRLEFVCLSHTKITDAGMKQLARIAPLSNIDLEGTKITDAGLRHLSALPNLQLLGLRGTHITDTGLKDLNAPALIHLNLGNTSVSDAGLVGLARLKNLEDLRLEGTTVTDNGLKHLTRIAGLKSLSLSGSVGDAGGRALSKLPELRVIHLSGAGVTDASLEALANCSILEDVWLTATKVTDAGVKALQRVRPNCRVHRQGEAVKASSPSRPSADELAAARWVFSLDGRIVAERDGVQHAFGSGEEEPSSPWALTEVHLVGHGGVEDAGLKHLSRLPDLRQIHLGSTRVGDEGLRYLGALPLLEVLGVAETRVTDPGLRSLSGLKRLRVVDLNRTAVTDAGIESLVGLPLKRIRLNGTAVTDAGLKSLAKFAGLEQLDLRNTRVTPASVAALRRTLPKCLIVSGSANPD